MVDALPELFIERLRLLVGDSFQNVLNSYSLERKPSIRVNVLVVEEAVCTARLKELGFELEAVAMLSYAYRVLNKTKRNLTDTEEYKNGWFYIQSLSSMLPVQVLSEEFTVGSLEQLRVLDMCAAPGSKTSQLVSVLENKGHIVANDSSRQRLYQLAANLKICKARNTETLLYRGEFLWKKFGPVFDVVLLDAPCSGEGRFDLKDSKTYEDWSLKKVERLSQLQKQLMFSAIMCLKPGGVLVYSTCTLSPEENEAVVDFALRKFETAIDIEEISLRDGIFQQGIVSWGSEIYDSRTARCLRIVPGSLWDGFFVTKIRRAG